MAKRPKRDLEPNLLDKFMAEHGEELENLDLPAMSPGEIATATVSMLPLPMLSMLDIEDDLPALWVAINPELSTAEVDQGLGRMEDVLIATLAMIRNHRRSMTDGLDAAGLQARAAVKFGAAASQVIETMLDLDSDFELVGIDHTTLKANLKALKARR